MDSGSPNNLDFKSLSEMALLQPDARTSRKASEARSINQQKIKQAVGLILEAIGEDPLREGLLDTPDRVARMWLELAAGHEVDPAEQISCQFIEPESGVVIVKDIAFASTCEHHLLPFSGTAHIAYLPRAGRITGLSKLARVVDMAARRLQVQERLTAQIAQALIDKLDPVGVLVMVEAEHTCMSMRGIKKPGSRTITIDSRGCYRDDVQLRHELLSLLNRS